jgi:hypothetical protein
MPLCAADLDAAIAEMESRAERAAGHSASLGLVPGVAAHAAAGFCRPAPGSTPALAALDARAKRLALDVAEEAATNAALREELEALEADEAALQRARNVLAAEAALVAFGAQRQQTRMRHVREGLAQLGVASTDKRFATDLAQAELMFPSADADDRSSSAGGSEPSHTSFNRARASESFVGTSTANQLSLMRRATIFAVGSSSASTTGGDGVPRPLTVAALPLGILHAAFRIDLTDPVPRINGCRLGRLPSVQPPVADEEINAACGFLVHLLDRLQKVFAADLNTMGCSFVVQGSRSQIEVYAPKHAVLDFFIERRIFSWSTFGAAWVAVAIGVGQLLSKAQGNTRLLLDRCKQRRVRASDPPALDSTLNAPRHAGSLALVDDDDVDRGGFVLNDSVADKTGLYEDAIPGARSGRRSARGSMMANAPPRLPVTEARRSASAESTGERGTRRSAAAAAPSDAVPADMSPQRAMRPAKLSAVDVDGVIDAVSAHLLAARALPRIAANGHTVDEFNVKHGDASDTQWTSAVRALLQCVCWCVDAARALDEL